MTRMLALTALVLFLVAFTPVAHSDLLSGVTAQRTAILFCYDHFNDADHAALGALLKVEGNSPLSLADGPQFAARINEICQSDPLAEGCETPAGRMQSCISAIVLD